jgi:hypothetical protein
MIRFCVLLKECAMRLCLKPCRATVPFLSVLALCLAAGASAQQITQKVTGPKARYWLSAETVSGMPGLGAAGASSGGLGAMMGALTGMGGGSRRNLLLELGSVQGPVGGAADPVGDHSIPGGMGMGASLPLLSPERSGPPPARRSDERDVPEQREQPEGNARMLFFWGCGENAGADQPVVLDMKQIMDGKLPPSMASYNVNMGPTGPQFGRDRSYMAWPNRKDSQAVPATSSMVGDHLVTSNASPEIRFGVQGKHDFMEGLSLSSDALPSGAIQLRWNSVPTAIGYFSTAMGFRQTAEKSMDMVMWNSSAKRMLGGERLMAFLPAAEVARLQRDHVVMPENQTECAIPKQAVEAAGGNMTMLNLNGFGPELNVVYPPRPQDPKIDWNQEYAVKLRLRSYTNSIAGLSDGARTSGQRPSRSQVPSQDSRTIDTPARGSTAPSGGAPIPDIGNAVEGGVKLLKGLFGR